MSVSDIFSDELTLRSLKSSNIILLTLPDLAGVATVSYCVIASLRFRAFIGEDYAFLKLYFKKVLFLFRESTVSFL